ncbi:unnamed protein product [Bursaphelenchus okinawaensis]|uniref:PPPDE domain-containing protein n=1 Tax=Bursaphelenchus okinawaensis TaxID=465554 RepID=A0A811L9Q5_9BILA|nr:unnamed protein product [Bursaphelenchus okinawaensis]CAG9121672.1 unnamed protein product [Bursaphelenchus okinawaensis]
MTTLRLLDLGFFTLELKCMVEYTYGEHQFPFSGIFTNQPQYAEELGENFKFRESIVVGETDLTEKAVEKLVKSWGEEFRGDRYHLITKNCNHFTANFARELTGKDAPGWVNRLANVSNSISFLDKMLPMEWLTPMALADTLDRETNDKKTLNYPVEKAEEAIFECGSLNSKRKISIDQSPTNPGTRRSFFVFLLFSKHIIFTPPGGPAVLWTLPCSRPYCILSFTVP